MKGIAHAAVSMLMVANVMAAGSDMSGVSSDDPNVLAERVIDNLLSRDHMLYGRKGIHYAEACTVIGALRYVEKTRDDDRLDQIIERYKVMLDEDSQLISRHQHVDFNVMGIIPLQIYMINRNRDYLKMGLSFADQQWENPIEGGLTPQTRWWIDDMYMVGMLQIQAYRATNKSKYADRAALQLAAYLKKLQQEDGLFYHGPDSHFYWGRGNGWVAVSLAEVLRDLPRNHKLRPEIMKGYKLMMEALLKHQSDNGMWRQVIDYEYSWAETSCTAMFAYAMKVGVNERWLEPGAYVPAVKKAQKALCAHVDRKGRLREICVGTNKKNDIEFYLNRPRTLGDFHGQAPFLWLVAE